MYYHVRTLGHFVHLNFSLLTFLGKKNGFSLLLSFESHGGGSKHTCVQVCTCYVEGMGVYNKICTSSFCLSKWALGLEPRLPGLAASPFIC